MSLSELKSTRLAFACGNLKKVLLSKLSMSLKTPRFSHLFISEVEINILVLDIYE